MRVFRWGNALDVFRDLEREMDRLLQSVNFGMEGLRIGRQYPAVNIYDLDDEFLLTAELPGTRVEDLELSVTSGRLTMQGKRCDPDEIPEHQYRRSERPHGSWQRSFALPERVLEDSIRAELRDGVLKLHLPKQPSTVPRQIPIANTPQT